MKRKYRPFTTQRHPSKRRKGLNQKKRSIFFVSIARFFVDLAIMKCKSLSCNSLNFRFMVKRGSTDVLHIECENCDLKFSVCVIATCQNFLTLKYAESRHSHDHPKCPISKCRYVSSNYPNVMNHFFSNHYFPYLKEKGISNEGAISSDFLRSSLGISNPIINLGNNNSDNNNIPNVLSPPQPQPQQPPPTPTYNSNIDYDYGPGDSIVFSGDEDEGNDNNNNSDQDLQDLSDIPLSVEENENSVPNVVIIQDEAELEEELDEKEQERMEKIIKKFKKKRNKREKKKEEERKRKNEMNDEGDENVIQNDEDESSDDENDDENEKLTSIEKEDRRDERNYHRFKSRELFDDEESDEEEEIETEEVVEVEETEGENDSEESDSDDSDSSEEISIGIENYRIKTIKNDFVKIPNKEKYLRNYKKGNFFWKKFERKRKKRRNLSKPIKTKKYLKEKIERKIRSRATYNYNLKGGKTIGRSSDGKVLKTKNGIPLKAIVHPDKVDETKDFYEDENNEKWKIIKRTNKYSMYDDYGQMGGKARVSNALFHLERSTPKKSYDRYFANLLDGKPGNSFQSSTHVDTTWHNMKKFVDDLLPTKMEKFGTNPEEEWKSLNNDIPYPELRYQMLGESKEVLDCVKEFDDTTESGFISMEHILGETFMNPIHFGNLILFPPNYGKSETEDEFDCEDFIKSYAESPEFLRLFEHLYFKYGCVVLVWLDWSDGLNLWRFQFTKGKLVNVTKKCLNLKYSFFRKKRSTFMSSTYNPHFVNTSTVNFKNCKDMKTFERCISYSHTVDRWIKIYNIFKGIYDTPEKNERLQHNKPTKLSKYISTRFIAKGSDILNKGFDFTQVIETKSVKTLIDDVSGEESWRYLNSRITFLQKISTATGIKFMKKFYLILKVVVKGKVKDKKKLIGRSFHPSVGLFDFFDDVFSDNGELLYSVIESFSLSDIDHVIFKSLVLSFGQEVCLMEGMDKEIHIRKLMFKLNKRVNIFVRKISKEDLSKDFDRWNNFDTIKTLGDFFPFFGDVVQHECVREGLSIISLMVAILTKKYQSTRDIINLQELVSLLCDIIKKKMKNLYKDLYPNAKDLCLGERKKPTFFYLLSLIFVDLVKSIVSNYNRTIHEERINKNTREIKNQNNRMNNSTCLEIYDKKRRVLLQCKQLLIFKTIDYDIHLPESLGPIEFQRGDEVIDSEIFNEIVSGTRIHVVNNVFETNIFKVKRILNHNKKYDITPGKMLIQICEKENYNCYGICREIYLIEKTTYSILVFKFKKVKILNERVFGLLKDVKKYVSKGYKINILAKFSVTQSEWEEQYENCHFIVGNALYNKNKINIAFNLYG